MKTVYIELTEEQKEKLEPLFDAVTDGSEKKKQVILMAQIHVSGRDAVAVCRIIDHEKSAKIQEVLNPKIVGKIVGYVHTQKALDKARAR